MSPNRFHTTAARLTLGTAALALALGLTGCGETAGGDGKPSASPSVSTAESTPAEDAAPSADDSSESHDDGPSPSEDTPPTDNTGPTESSSAPPDDIEPPRPTASPTDEGSAPASPAPSDDGTSPEAGAFGSKDGFATGAQIDLAQDTGAEELVEPAEYSGPPRPIADVHHLSCLMGLPGVSEIPETESAEPAMEPWDFTAHQQLPEGWKECRLATMGSFQVPASFSIEHITADEAEITDAIIRDAMGQTVGGFHLSTEPTAAPEALTVVDAPEVTVLETPEMGQDNERHLRTLVVDGPSGPHLLIDQVSVPSGADPASLEHWDVVRIGENSHAHMWASIPLESADAAAAAMDTDLYREARSMVASYLEGQQ